MHVKVKQSQTKPILFSPQNFLGVENGVEKSKLFLLGHRLAENAAVWVCVPEPNKMDVNICGRLEYSAKTWYFIGN